MKKSTYCHEDRLESMGATAEVYIEAKPRSPTTISFANGKNDCPSLSEWRERVKPQKFMQLTGAEDLRA